MLEAVHLVKRYSGSAVVNDVSFAVRPGEVLGGRGHTLAPPFSASPLSDGPRALGLAE